ncbi:MAG: glycoside hydrolase family 5 protein [Caldilineaceae bacterium]|nr:glycoside hydrolase family 5 protein [Caldilineaceae bacterium]
MLHRTKEPNFLLVLLLGVLLLLLGSCGRFAAPSTETEELQSASAPVDAFAMNEALGRGVNMGNALEAMYEGEWGMTLEAEYFQLIAEARFTNVRIPIRWTAHADEMAPYTIDPEFLARVDWAIAQALANNLSPIINMHHYDAIMQEPDVHRERFLAIWRQLAEHYQDQPSNVIFELLNEPNSKLFAAQWNKLLAEAIAVVRESNPNRIIIVGPVGWNNVGQLATLELPEDDRQLIVTFHQYEPFHFTHQGAEWVNGSDAWLGTTWEGTDSQKRQITQILDSAAAWGETHDRPIFMGEFGAYSKADMASRARWTAFLVNEAEARGFSWAYWEFGAGFGVYDREQTAWNEPLLEALVRK